MAWFICWLLGLTNDEDDSNGTRGTNEDND